LVLHGFWAIGNGVFPRYAKFFLPPFIAMAMGMLVLEIEAYELVAIC